MDRRRFLSLSALATGSAGLATPALAQSPADIRWRCVSGFPPSLTTLYGAAELLAETVSEATDGRFQITLVAADEAVMGLDALDAVQAGNVDLIHTAPHYFSPRDPAFAFGSGLPFGLNQRLTDAWLYEGGGLDLFNAFLADYGVVGLPAGNTGAQMGGWFNREINGLDDMAGLRLRIGGFGARIFEEVGITPVALAPEAIVGAMRAEEIDAAEFAGPADDLALGLNEVARYLYYPGWWEAGISLMAMIKRQSFEALSAADKAVLRHAANTVNIRTLARYDTRNPAAMADIEASGIIVRPYGSDIMDACFAAAEQVYRDLSAENAAFGELLTSYMAYREAGYGWMRYADYAFNTYMMILSRGGRL